MTADQLRSALRKMPFQPFVLYTQSGESYHVSHPETMWVEPPPEGTTVIVATRPGVALMDVSNVTEVVYSRGTLESAR